MEEGKLENGNFRRQTNLNDDMHIKFFGVESNAFIESSSLAVIQVHGHIYLHLHFLSYKNEIYAHTSKKINNLHVIKPVEKVHSNSLACNYKNLHYI